MSEKSSLPSGWALARIDALVKLVNGFAFKPEQWKSEGLPIIRIQNLNNVDAPYNYCSDELPEKFRVRNGDLLFAWSGTPGTSFGAHVWRGGDAWLNQHIFNVVFDRQHLDEKFLRFAINQNLDSYIRQAHGGAGLAHITKGRFEQSELSIAPLNEQRRIVSKIEELFSDLDAGVAALKRAKANLKRYRAAVLKAAVEGKLTEEWRAKHPHAEPASKLLARILTERRQKWESDQLAKFAAAGKEPPKGWKEKYVEPTPPDTTSLRELPGGWCWTRSGYLCDCIVPNRDKPKSFSGDIPWITLPDFDGTIELMSSRKGLGLTQIEAARYRAKIIPAGSVIMSCVGRFGISAVLGRDSVINQQLHAFLIPTHVVARYVAYALSTQEGYMKSLATATTIAYLNQDNCNSIPMPFPPTDEQIEIVKLVDERISQIEQAAKEIDRTLNGAARLRQSILKQAFEGKLVPQDSSDEPASLLLERLEKIWDNDTPQEHRRESTKNGKRQNSNTLK